MMKLINIIKKRKRLLVVIIPLVLLVLNYLLTSFINPKDPIPTPTPITSPGPTKANITSSPNKPQTNPPILYHSQSTKKMFEKLKNRTPLSVKDESAKKRILSSIKDRSVTLRTAPTFRIEYISSPDVFMVEIKTIDIGKGKLDAKNWLISQGFTEQGACELPVVYYLNSDVSSRLRDFGITFSPLASGC